MIPQRPVPPRFSRRSLLTAVPAALAACAGRRDPRPNILLIMADDLGYETLGCYGGTSYRTPNLDRLAETGIRFTHAHAQPLCTPTRVQLMTGKSNCRNWRAFGVMDPGERTFAHLMHDAGYRTCISGKWQLYSYNPPDFEPEWRGRGMKPEQSGFDEYCLWHAGHTEEKGSRYADPVILENGRLRDDTKGRYGPDVFADYLTGFIERNANRPFFAYYPMALTHGPFNPTPRSAVWSAGNRLESHPRYYADMVEYMDVVIGRVVSKLDELNLRERTLILYYSDNGSPKGIESRLGGRAVPGGKGLTTDAGTHVPFLANWPGNAPSGQVLDHLVDSTDFYPTLAELAGANLSAEGVMDGRSLAPQLRGRPGNPREWLFFHFDPRPGADKKGYTLQRWVQDHRHKLYHDGRLYDLTADILEQNPLPPGAAAEVRARLQPVLARFPNPGPNVAPGTPGY